MLYNIRNEELSVDINTAGASLTIIKDKDGTEYLWQGRQDILGRQSTQSVSLYRPHDGQNLYAFWKEYHMNIHGFVEIYGAFPVRAGGENILPWN